MAPLLAALGHDPKPLMDALRIERAVQVGCDRGGRAAYVVAALWPGRCAGLLSFNCHNIQDIGRATTPDTPRNAHRLWYQHDYHSECGRRGLAGDRRGTAACCRGSGRRLGRWTKRASSAAQRPSTTPTSSTW